MPGSRSLPEWLEMLEVLQPDRIELGLDRVNDVAGNMSVYEKLPVTITMAGTNGKGSCVTACQQILSRLGFRVGSYLSPHIHNFNERIRINGVPVTDEQLVAAFEHVEAVRENTRLTYFEFTTLAALSIFSVARLDVIVLEVGLGGRLDAVNVIDPDVAVITGIGLDHTQWLGETEEEIAAEKAGILRPGIPCVLGERRNLLSIAEKATSLGTKLYRLGVEFDLDRRDGGWDWRGFASGSHIKLEGLPCNQGNIDEQDIAIGLQACLLSPLAPDPLMLAGQLQGLSLEGRYETRTLEGQQFILDVGHNAQAAKFVAERLVRDGHELPLTGVLGMLSDKDPRSFIDAFEGVVGHWYVAPLASQRSIAWDDWQYIARDDSITLCSSVSQALELACSRNNRPVLVTGSFYTVEEAGLYLQSREGAGVAG